MADYQLVDTSPIVAPHAFGGDAVIRTSDGAHIPADPNNMDYVAYLKWLEAGGVPDPYVPPPLSRAQQAEAHLAKGLALTFDDPTLNGTYSAVRPQTLVYNAISTGLAAGDGFPNNAATVQIMDLDKKLHTFGKPQFAKFIKAVRNFIYNTQLYAAEQAQELPPSSQVIPGA